jgi:uncharacterized membrane protein HdeD (DUF308 family)
MRRNGPIPLKVHAMTDPVIGVLFIIAPFVLGFDHNSAKTLSIVVGAIILIGAMSTRWRLSLVKLLSLRMHFWTDVLLGIVCIAAPFVLGFSDETAPLVWFLVMGVGELGAAFGTAWEPAGEASAVTAPSPRTGPLSS